MRLNFLPRLQYADNTTLNSGSGGDVIRSTDVAGVKTQHAKIDFGGTGVSSPVTQTNPLPMAFAAKSDSTMAWSESKSTALEDRRVIKASAGYLKTILVYNSADFTQYIMVFNTTSLPVDTTFSPIVMSVAPKSNVTLLFDEGAYFSTGITVGNSTTDTALTSGAADCIFFCLYK